MLDPSAARQRDLPAAGRQRKILRAAPFVALASLLAGPAGAAPLPDIEVTPRAGAPLPLGARFVDETGSSLTLGEALGGRPAVLVFEYLSCPNVCGVVLADLAAALADQKLRAGRDFDVVAISIDRRDTPGDATRVKQRLGVGAGWRFLTGGGEPAHAVAAAAGFPYQWDAGLGQFVHPAAAIVVAQDGSVGRYLLGAGYDPAALGAALSDPAPRSDEPVALGRRLLCWGGAALSSAYGALVQNAVRAVGLVTILALIALIAWARSGRQEGS